MQGDLIFYPFSRSKVEQCDFSHFLSRYSPDKLPAGRALQEIMNMMLFAIDGWDDDPREIHTVPEIRQFYSAFHDVWPYWFYFLNLEVDALRAMTLCCLPSVGTMQPMNLMCERAEMSERSIYDRTRAVFEYFGLPFDADPPP